MKMTTCLLTGVALAAMSGAAPAIAQDAQPAAPDPAVAPQASIGDIVVTARKQEEKLQRVPITVAAVSTAQIKQQTIQSTQDVQFHVPGLVQAPEPQGQQPDFAIRGTRQQGAIGSQGGVAVYVDYIPLLSTNSIAYSTYDMQSIQVLKGPQGTLFGKNTTGGALIFAPNKPTQKFEGFLTGGYGNYNRRELTGMINIPLSDTLALRVSGSYVHRDGYTKNVADTGPSRLDDERHESGRAILRWTPTSDITNDLMVDLTHIHNHPLADHNLAVDSPCTAVYPNCAAQAAEQQTLGKRKVDLPEDLYSVSRNWGVGDTLSLNLGGITIRNIASYRRDRYNDAVDNDGLAVPLLAGYDHTRGKSITEELDLIGKLFNDKLDYTVGFFYSNDRFHQHYEVPILAEEFDANGNVTGGLPPYFQTGPSLANNHFHNIQKAVFGQLNLHITSKLTLTGGARYTDVDETASQQNYVGTVSPTDNTPACLTNRIYPGDPGLDAATCTETQKFSFKPITWNASLNYQLLPSTLLYVSAGRGFQAGGVNTQIPLTAYQTFRPETVQSYEGGIKSDWHFAGRPGRTNVAVFYSKYSNAQRSINGTLDPAFGFGPIAYIGTFNAASSTIYGAELEFNYLPTPRLELSAFYSYTHAKYNKFITPPFDANGSQNLSNAAISSTPKNTGGGTIAYSFPMPNDGKLRISVSDYFRSSTYANDIVQTQYTKLKGYNLVNARIDLIKTLPVDVAFWMNNVTNKTYRLFGFDLLTNSLGYASDQYGPPRTFGVEATFKF
jgi:iron complex outermembrane receptor protein